MGCLFAFGSIGIAVMVAAMRAQRPGAAPPSPGESAGTCLGVCIGILLLFAGFRVVRGSAPDVFVTSLMSVLLGAFYLLAAGASYKLLAKQPDFRLMTTAFCGVVGVGLVAPAWLALSARDRYLAWRAANDPRRGRSYDDEWDEDRDDRPDDQPWGRGRRS
jgi:hypothetical protein